MSAVSGRGVLPLYREHGVRQSSTPYDVFFFFDKKTITYRRLLSVDALLQLPSAAAVQRLAAWQQLYYLSISLVEI